MNRKVFAHLRTLIYATLVSMLSISFTACDSETPETGNSNNITITIDQYGSKTYCGASALDFSEVEGLKAYVATGYDGETLTLTRIMTVKAGEGILIKGSAGNYEVPVIERSDENALNMFVGVQGRTTVYAQSQDEIYTNYYWTADTMNDYFGLISGSVVLDNSAYLQIPTAWEGPKAISALRFDDGEYADTENGK